jgi:hypothetical protein
MHNARGQRRLDRMTGRGVASANGLDRRALPKPHVAARGAPHFGYPLAKLGGNTDLSLPSASTCVFFPFVLTLLFLHTIVLHVPSGKISRNVLVAANTVSRGFSSVDLQAVEKNTTTPAVTPAAANTIGLDIQLNDVGYIATIQIGTPPRNFKILMDSGSADFWVGADTCFNLDDSSDCVSSFSNSFSSYQLTYPHWDVGDQTSISWNSVLEFISEFKWSIYTIVWLWNRFRQYRFRQRRYRRLAAWWSPDWCSQQRVRQLYSCRLRWHHGCGPE